MDMWQPAEVPSCPAREAPAPCWCVSLLSAPALDCRGSEDTSKAGLLFLLSVGGQGMGGEVEDWPVNPISHPAAGILTPQACLHLYADE